MKQTDRIMKVTAVLLFAALLSYLGVYLVRAIRSPFQTAEVVGATIQESAPAYGIAVRGELILETNKSNIDIAALDGLRVSKGAPIAVSYGSVEAMLRASRIRELELEIMRVRTLLSALTSAEDLSIRDSAVRAALYDLTSAVSRHELSELDSHSLRLRSLVFDNNGENVTEADLTSLQSELNRLVFAGDVDTVPVLAPEAGIYTNIVDGYEHLTFGSMRYFTPDELRHAMELRIDPPSSSIGKIVTSAIWHFICVMDVESAARLKPPENTSGTAVIEFGRYYSSPLKVKIVSVGAAVDGECVVIFECNEALVETLAMREVAAEVVYAEYSGLRVPNPALYFDENGSIYIYTLTGPQADLKRVRIVYESDSFSLVENDFTEEEKQNPPDYALRSGHIAIVNGRDLYDGKVVR